MTTSPLPIAVFGCGDYLRWQEADLKKSRHLRIKWLFDPDKSRAEKAATLFGGKAANDAEQIFSDPEVFAVVLFVPPWLRAQLIECAGSAGKHIIATKPLAHDEESCLAILQTVEKTNVRCGVWYLRTGNSVIRTYREIFDSGEIGELGLYRQDWIHHYPVWNKWATDPGKNGGPFMDAMIHNLNVARHLMARPAVRATLFSDRLAHPDLPCADTETMKLDFEGNGSALLFITWAADLQIHSTEGNNREHIDVNYLISSQGWRLTHGSIDGKNSIKATRGVGEEKIWEVTPYASTSYDRFLEAILENKPNPADVPNAHEAAEDILLVRQAMASAGTSIPFPGISTRELITAP